MKLFDAKKRNIVFESGIFKQASEIRFRHDKQFIERLIENKNDLILPRVSQLNKMN